jgi:hypothetical protein
MCLHSSILYVSKYFKAICAFIEGECFFLVQRFLSCMYLHVFFLFTCFEHNAHSTFGFHDAIALVF